MTAFNAIMAGEGRSRHNIKDGPRWRQPAVQPTGFWGVENFMPTAPDEWLYTWQGIECPSFVVIEAGSETTVTLEGGEIEAVFTDVPHIEIKDWLDGQILRLIMLQADVDAPIDWEPEVINGQVIGPEISF
jgi:hypothetical protein